MTEALHITVMLSFDVLIGLHKVPELFLALFCQEFTEGEGEEEGDNLKFQSLIQTVRQNPICSLSTLKPGWLFCCPNSHKSH